VFFVSASDWPNLGSTRIGPPLNIDGMETDARRASQYDCTRSHSSIGA